MQLFDDLQDLLPVNLGASVPSPTLSRHNLSRGEFGSMEQYADLDYHRQLLSGHLQSTCSTISISVNDWTRSQFLRSLVVGWPRICTKTAQCEGVHVSGRRPKLITVSPRTSKPYHLYMTKGIFTQFSQEDWVHLEQVSRVLARFEELTRLASAKQSFISLAVRTNIS